MPRISGVEILEKHTIQHALIAVYGVGRSNVQDILKKAHVLPTARVHALQEADIKNIQATIDTTVMVEGDLRRATQDNIKRLKVIGTYRGKRHNAGLPVRGQRTKTNARTGRGKRKTVGAMKKDDRAKVETTDKK